MALGQSGHQHFTGKKAGKRVVRKGKSKKERLKNRGDHKNKYAHLAPKKPYDAQDKTFRRLPIHGTPGETVREGQLVLFHGRRYVLREDVVVPDSGRTYGEYQLTK